MGPPNAGLTVAAAGPDSLPAVLDLWATSGAVPSSTDDLDGLRRLVGHDPGALLVATEGGVLVGTLVVGWDGWRGTFYRLVVRPSHRRRGVAAALVAEGERRLVAAGARRLQLTAVAAHDHATGFWEAAGYRADPGQRRYTKQVGAVSRR